jgi:hypothetical protein
LLIESAEIHFEIHFEIHVSLRFATHTANTIIIFHFYQRTTAMNSFPTTPNSPLAFVRSNNAIIAPEHLQSSPQAASSTLYVEQLTYRAMAASVLFVVAFACTVLLSSCFINNNPFGIQGSGNSTTENRTVSSFTGITNETSCDVEVINQSADAGKIEIQVDDNLLQYVRTEVQGSTLRIHTNGTSISPRRIFKIKVNAAMINKFDLLGSGNTNVRALNTPDFTALLSGSGDLTLAGTMTASTLRVSGSGNVTASGSGQRTELVLSGSGDINTRDLTVEQGSARISGSGDITIFASKTLDASISGSGNIRYYGNPSTVNRSVSGSGSIRAGN